LNSSSSFRSYIFIFWVAVDTSYAGYYTCLKHFSPFIAEQPDCEESKEKICTGHAIQQENNKKKRMKDQKRYTKNTPN
jgi:hypothetical protein